jgi:hypothetical protein
MTGWETSPERRGPARPRKQRSKRPEEGVSFVSSHQIRREFLLLLFSVRVGRCGWRWPKAEVELPTGNPYGQLCVQINADAFSGSQSRRGKSQSPRSLGGREEGNRDF